MVFLLVPTAAFAQTDFGSTSNQTISGFEPLDDIVMTPPQEIEITTPVTGFEELPHGIETSTYEKFQDGFTWELDEDGFLYQQWDADRLGTNPEPKLQYPQVTETYTIEQIDDETFSYSTHAPYVSDGYDWKPYVLGEDENVVQVQVAGGTVVFDKVAGAVTIFNDYETVIDSDSYTVRTALIGSDVWTNLDVNNADVETTVVEDGEKVTVSFIRENQEGLFKTEYVIGSGQVKTTAYFTNYIYDNNKFAFTQTVNLPDSIISLNDMEDIDLNNFVGQSFPREVLEENQDLILQIKDMYYSSGLGFENLWQVNIHENNTISLDYANVEQTQTAINETVELDPVISFSNGNELSTGVNSTTSTNCPTTSSSWVYYLRNYNSNPSYNGCRAPIVEFDISSIPDNATITDVDMTYEIDWINGVADNVDWNTIEGNTWVNTEQAWNDAVNYNNVGQSYVTNDAGALNGVGSINSVDLGTLGNTNVQNQLTSANSVNGVADWFAVAFPFSSITQTVLRDVGYTNVGMSVVYTLPPSSPTNVTTTANGSNVDLSWTASDNYSDHIVSSVANANDLGTSTSATCPSGGGVTTPTMGSSGKIGNGLYFDGVCDTLGTFNPDANSSQGSAVTLSVWLKSDIGTSSVADIPFGKIGAGYNYLILNNQWSSYGYANNSVTTNHLYSGANAFLPNVWNHYAFTVAADKTTHLYVNGVDIPLYTSYNSANHNSSTLSTSGNSSGNGADFYGWNVGSGLHTSTTNPTYFYKGWMDEMTTWHRVLSQSEISTLYNSGTGNHPSSVTNNNSLEHYLPFEDTSMPQENMAVTVDPLVVTYDVKRDGTSLGTTTNTSFTDTTTAFSTPYLFSLTASTSNGTSPSTANFPITPTVPEPTNLSASLNVPNVDLSWTGASGATGYKIEHSTDGTNWSTLVADTGNTNTTYSHTAPTQNSTNYYQVKTLIGSAESTANTATTDVTTSYDTIIIRNNNCTTGTSEIYPQGEKYGVGRGTWNDQCYRAFLEFDTTSIPDIATITDANFKFEVSNNQNAPSTRECEVIDAGTTIGTDTFDAKWTAVSNGSVIGSDSICTSVGTNRVINLDSSANTLIQNKLSSDYFTFGLRSSDEVTLGQFVQIYTADAGSWPNATQAITPHPTLSLTHTVSSSLAVGGTPDAPTGLTATFNVTTADMDLSWTAPSQTNGSAITGYKIEVSTDGTNFTDVTANTGSITTTHIDTSPTMGSLNYYKVSAINAYGAGADSNTDNDMAGVPPDAPTITSTSTASANSAPLEITVNWQAPTVTGTAGISNYEVYRDGALITTVGNVTTYVDTVTTGGGTFVYSLKSVTPHGTSVLSATASHTTPTPPPAPTSSPTLDIANPNPSPFDVTVSFAMPSSGGSAITSFEIFRSIDDVTFSSVGTTSTLLFSDTVPNAGTFYYKFASTNLVGNSGQSPSSNITTATVPTSDSSVTLAIADPNATPLDVTVSFTAPTSNGGSNVTGYNLSSSPDDSVYTQVATNVTADQTITVASPGTWYFKSQAINPVGTSAFGSSVSVTTATVPVVITDLGISGVTDTTSTLTWTEPSNGGSNIVDYTVFRDGALVGTVTTPGFSDTGLTTQTSYVYTVFVRNNAGTSLVSNSVTQVTQGVPAAVSSFSAVTASLESITLSWTAPNDFGSAITGYLIERESPTGNGFTTLITTGPNVNYSDPGLTSVTEYNYRISAINSYGNSLTTVSSAVTLPAPPTSVVATPSASTSELVITWNTPTLTTGITGYQILREDGIGTGFVPISVVAGVSFTDTGLSPNIYYNYKLASVSTQGNSAYSNTYSQTTFNLPDPVTTLTATAGDLIDAGLTWTPPAIPYASVTEYQIFQGEVPGTPTVLIDTLGPAALSYTATNLDPTVTYYWMVAPVTIHGTNTSGNVANATATSEIIIGSIIVSDDVNPIQLPVLFNEVRNGSSTALTVTYATGTNLACSFDNKFARTTTVHDNLTETYVTSVKSSHTFTLNDSANEIISVHCYDKDVNADGTLLNDETDGNYQINFATQPIVTQVNEFQKGAFGIQSGFGAFDLMTMFVVIISMVGFNRRSPAVGVGIMVAFIGAMAYFGIIETPTVVMGAIAVVVVLAIGQARKER